jgi:CubicO group peptidase (beta-lactamase class C family)
MERAGLTMGEMFNFTLKDAVFELSKLPLSFKPGSRWEYSVSTDLLGRVIEIVFGKTLDKVFREEIFEPLGMEETSFKIDPKSIDRFASLYSPLEGNSLTLVDHRDTTPYRNPLLFSGGGGLVSTIDDYMKFGEMICAGGIYNDTRIISSKTLNFMRLNHLRGDIASLGPESFAEQPMDGMGFGLGGAVVLNPGLTRIPGNVGDFGWGGMASTFFWTDPVNSMSVVFFTQLSPSSSYSNRAELKALVHGAMIN